MARSGGFVAHPRECPGRTGSCQTRRPVSRAPSLARTPPSKHTLKLLVVPVIGLVICSNIANVMWPTLSEDHPLLLIALSSINRYLVLVSDQLGAVEYYAVGTLRLLVSDPLFFLIGYWYGDRALDWMDERSPNYGPMLRRFQDAFGKAAWPLVLIAPNNFICLFAGAAGMRVSVFFAVNLVGTVTRLYLIRVFGDIFSSPIDDVRGFIGDYQTPLIVLSAVVVAFTLRNEFKGGGDIDKLVHIDEELGDPAVPTDHPETGAEPTDHPGTAAEDER